MPGFIVIPEGLALDREGRYHVSDHYAAVLDLVMEKAVAGDKVYLAPANGFGAEMEEDLFGREYLLSRGCVASLVVVSSDVPRKGYLDTLDNALYLKKYLMQQGSWPLDEMILVCNKPHLLRAYTMFAWNGFKVSETMVSRALSRSGTTMVKRLWFYDVPIVQYLYEGLAMVHNTFRFIFISIF